MVFSTSVGVGRAVAIAVTVAVDADVDVDVDVVQSVCRGLETILGAMSQEVKIEALVDFALFVWQYRWEGCATMIVVLLL